MAKKKAADRPAPRGPCEQCRSFRRGTSIATTTFNSLLPAMQSIVQSTHLHALQDEASRVGARQREADDYAALGIDDPVLALDSYSWRPTESGYPYCGVSEFDGVFNITQIKNFANRCTDFATRESSVVHACETCAFLVGTPTQALREIEQVTLRLLEGQKLLTRIRSQFEASAPTEYQSCVSGAGVIDHQPSFLPWCQAWSVRGSVQAAPRFVIGPVVNVGKSCARWAPQGEATTPDTPDLAGLRAVWEEERRRATDSSLWTSLPQTPLSMMGDDWFTQYMDAEGDTIGGQLFWSDALKWSMRWAASELIAACLTQLGADETFVAMIRDDIVAENVPKGTRDDEMVNRVNAAAQREPAAAARIVPHLAAMRSNVGLRTTSPESSLDDRAPEPRPWWANPAATQNQLKQGYDDVVNTREPVWAAYAVARLQGKSHADADDLAGFVAYSHDPVGGAYLLAGQLWGRYPDAEEEAIRWYRIAAAGSAINPDVAENAARDLAERTGDGATSAGANEPGSLLAPAEELLPPEQVAALDRLTDPNTPLEEVFTASELALLKKIKSPELRHRQELDMRAEKARLTRRTLENLASMRHQMLEALENADDDEEVEDDQEVEDDEDVEGDDLYSGVATTLNEGRGQPLNQTTFAAPAARLPAPGWFPDPYGSPQWRWWDGLAWTSHTAPR